LSNPNFLLWSPATQWLDRNAATPLHLHVQLKSLQEFHSHQRRRIRFFNKNIDRLTVPDNRTDEGVAFNRAAIAKNDLRDLELGQAEFSDYVRR
jgi:hypothetical protein